MPQLDYHNQEAKFASTLEYVKRGGVPRFAKVQVTPLSERNRELILKYTEIRRLSGARLATARGDMVRLATLGKMAKKDFDAMTIEDCKALVAEINGRYRSPWMSSRLRTTFKNFFKWVRQGDTFRENGEFPSEVSWIRRGLKKKDLRKLSAEDMYTEEEIKSVIEAGRSTQERALLALLTEAGLRPQEIGNLKVGDVYRDDQSFVLHIPGKIEPRDSRVVYAGPYLAAWLNEHPQRNNREAPLWLNRNGKQRSYSSFRHLVKMACVRAGVRKRNNPYIFRHTRFTNLLEKGIPVQLVETYMGLQPGSGIIATYSHISSRAANDAMLRMHGLIPQEIKESGLQVRVCRVCHNENPLTFNYCQKCNRPLDMAASLERNEMLHHLGNALAFLLKLPKVQEAIERELSSEGKGGDFEKYFQGL